MRKDGNGNVLLVLFFVDWMSIISFWKVFGAAEEGRVDTQGCDLVVSEVCGEP